jgi:hypothetical protein
MYGFRKAGHYPHISPVGAPPHIGPVTTARVIPLAGCVGVGIIFIAVLILVALGVIF